MPSDRATLAACRWELQNQVQHHIYQALLHEMPLFKDIVPARHDPSSGAALAPSMEGISDDEYIVNLLCNDFRPVRVLVGQTVYSEGEIGGEFYIITSGAVILTSSHGYKRRMEQGDFFGERELFFSRRFNDDADGDTGMKELPIHGRHRHQTATCTADAELKFIKWPRLILLKQGGAMGNAIYNRIKSAAQERAADDKEITARKSNRNVVNAMMMHA